MIALSIKVPEHLAEQSRQVARKLGITRSELIRRADTGQQQQLRRVDRPAGEDYAAGFCSQDLPPLAVFDTGRACAVE